MSNFTMASDDAAGAPCYDEGDNAWVLTSMVLVLGMTLGLAFFTAGQIRWEERGEGGEREGRDHRSERTEETRRELKRSWKFVAKRCLAAASAAWRRRRMIRGHVGRTVRRSWSRARARLGEGDMCLWVFLPLQL
jgi:hypothetical protein